MKRLAVSAVVGAFGLLGLFGAAGASGSSGYALGLLLFAASLAYIFWMLKQHFDGAPDRAMFDIWPERPRNGWLLLAVLAALGLLGLFLASGGDPYLYWFGICLFAACSVMGLNVMKRIFDQHDRGGPNAGGAGLP